MPTDEKITKEDWKRAREQFAALLVNSMVNIEGFRHQLEFIDEKLKEFPDESKDEMPEEIKEIVKELKDA